MNKFNKQLPGDICFVWGKFPDWDLQFGLLAINGEVIRCSMDELPEDESDGYAVGDVLSAILNQGVNLAFALQKPMFAMEIRSDTFYTSRKDPELPMCEDMGKWRSWKPLLNLASNQPLADWEKIEPGEKLANGKKTKPHFVGEETEYDEVKVSMFQNAAGFIQIATLTQMDVKRHLYRLGYESSLTNIYAVKTALEHSWNCYSPEDYLRDEIARATATVSPYLKRREEIFGADA